MIANIALDNAVQRHVDALAENGDVGWKEGGEKRREWMKRKEYEHLNFVTLFLAFFEIHVLILILSL